VLIYAAAGILVGVAYTLSPLTVLCLLAIALLIWLSGRGLEPAERHRLEMILIVAIGVRVLAVAGLFLLTDHARVPFGSFFGDEEYFLRRSMWLRNVGLGIPIHSADLIYAFDDYSETSQLYVLGFLQTLVGFAPYGAHLVGITLYLGTAVLLFRLVRPAFGAMPALVGLVLMLVLPSLFAWSISALKEPLFFALTAGTLSSVVAAIREPRWQWRIPFIAIAIAGALILQTLRRAGFVLEAASVAGGIALAWTIVRPRLFVAAALAITLAGAVVLSRPRVQFAVGEALIQAATYHRGHIWTPGLTYRLLDDRLYGELVDIRTMRGDEAARYVARALMAYVTVPLPTQIYSAAALAFLPEQMVWYLLVALVPAGLVFAMRRDVLIASLLLTHAAVAALLIAFTSGNIGTLVRHRGFALPYLIWISAVGVCELVARGVSSRRIVKA
jgi:hypothetical protein